MTVPLAAVYGGVGGGVGGSLVGLMRGRRVAYDSNENGYRSDSACNRFKKVVVGGVVGGSLGLAAGWMLDLAARVTVAGVIALGNLATRLWAEATIQMPKIAAMMPQVAGEAVKFVSAHPIGIAVVAVAISSLALLALMSRRNQSEMSRSDLDEVFD